MTLKLSPEFMNHNIKPNESLTIYYCDIKSLSDQNSTNIHVVNSNLKIYILDKICFP